MGKVIKEYHQIFKGEYVNLNSIREYVAKVAQEAGLSSSAIYGIELAVDEACSNIIDHAYGGESRGEIECNALIREDGLEIILKDKGKPFDPNKIPEPDIQKPLKRVHNRGVGFFLIKQMVDKLEYHFSEKEGNVMRLFKSK